jgi:hypothetical protein
MGTSNSVSDTFSTIGKGYVFIIKICMILFGIFMIILGIKFSLEKPTYDSTGKLIKKNPKTYIWSGICIILIGFLYSWLVNRYYWLSVGEGGSAMMDVARLGGVKF